MRGAAWIVVACAGAVVAGGARAQAAASPDTAPLPAPDPYEQASAYPELDVYAPRLLPGAKRASERDPAAARAAGPGLAQGGGLAAWPRLYGDDALRLTGSVSGTLAAFKMWNNAFAPPPALQAPGAPADPAWGEWFLEAGLAARYAITATLALHGSVSYLESGTRGRDYAGNANLAHGDTETLRAGVTWTGGAGTVDLSYGQQELTLGDGMLLWSGATNGAQRGAAYVAPRTAWARAAIAKLAWHDGAVEAFHLVPNEAPADETGTRIAGANVEWKAAGPLRIGATYMHVPRSQIVTRDGMSVIDLRVRWHPVAADPAFWLQGEYAYQTSPLARASGWYAQASYNARTWPWKPLLSVQVSRLSGDDPGTTRWEGFDPLYFGNGNPHWYPGKIASTFIDNTNLAVASVNLTLTPSERSIVEFWVLGFRAVRTNAPLAIPDPDAPPPAGGGVPARALATEVDASWTITLGKALNVNFIAGWATPGRGYDELYAAAGGRARASWLVGTQLNVSF